MCWSGNPERVTAEVLAQLTRQASGGGLKMGAFRPQRVQLLDGAQELPYSVQVSGPFPAVRAFAASLDSSGGKLAVRSIQIAASDASSSTVTATITLSAYVTSEPEKTNNSTTKGAAHG